MKKLLCITIAVLAVHILHGSQVEFKVARVLSELSSDEIIDTLKSYEALLNSKDSSLSHDIRKKIEVLMIYRSKDLVENREFLAERSKSKNNKQLSNDKKSESLEDLTKDHESNLIKEFKTDLKLCKLQLKRLKAVYPLSK